MIDYTVMDVYLLNLMLDGDYHNYSITGARLGL